MSIVDLEQFAKTLPGARVEGDCLLVDGPIGAARFMEIGDALSEDSVVSPHLAQIANVSFAFGSPADIKSLIIELKESAISRTHQQMEGAGLSDKAIEWLAIGHQGLSSRAAFHHLTGIRPPLMKEGDETAYPRDQGDLGRVFEMIDSVPEAMGRFDELRSLSPEWESIVDRWMADNLSNESASNIQGPE